MAGELAFKDEAAAEYDRAFAHVTAHFMPFLLRAAHLAPGIRVLDIATGTGLSAKAALAAVGPTGHVTAADLSPAMAEKARECLGKAPNVSVSVEDGQALSFSDGSNSQIGPGSMRHLARVRALAGWENHRYDLELARPRPPKSPSPPPA